MSLNVKQSQKLYNDIDNKYGMIMTYHEFYHYLDALHIILGESIDDVNLQSLMDFLYVSYTSHATNDPYLTKVDIDEQYKTLLYIGHINTKQYVDAMVANNIITIEELLANPNALDADVDLTTHIEEFYTN